MIVSVREFRMRGRGGAGRRSLRARILLSLVSVVLALGFAEIGLRILRYHPPEILTKSLMAEAVMEPGASFVYRGYLEGTICDFANPVVLNREGVGGGDFPSGAGGGVPVRRFRSWYPRGGFRCARPPGGVAGPGSA